MYLGTSRFSYDDWIGNFYLLGMPRREWLSYYTRGFNTCKISSPHYALLEPSSLKAMTENTSAFANNHWRGQSNGTIRQLQVMLD